MKKLLRHIFTRNTKFLSFISPQVNKDKKQKRKRRKASMKPKASSQSVPSNDIQNEADKEIPESSVVADDGMACVKSVSEDDRDKPSLSRQPSKTSRSSLVSGGEFYVVSMLMYYNAYRSSIYKSTISYNHYHTLRVRVISHNITCQSSSYQYLFTVFIYRIRYALTTHAIHTPHAARKCPITRHTSHTPPTHTHARITYSVRNRPCHVH